MTFLTLDQCAEWCEGNRFPLSYISAYRCKYPDLKNSMLHRLEYQTPKDSGKKVALVKLILNQIADQDEILLWCRNWEVFASCGHMPLLSRFRQAFGETQEFSKTPGHLTKPDEKDDAISILILFFGVFLGLFCFNVRRSKSVFRFS